jgi:hypothetical protein
MVVFEKDDVKTVEGQAVEQRLPVKEMRNTNKFLRNYAVGEKYKKIA